MQETLSKEEVKGPFAGRIIDSQRDLQYHCLLLDT